MKDHLEEGMCQGDFPTYLCEPVAPKIGVFKRIWFRILLLPIYTLIWIALRPRIGKVGKLDRDEVESVYERRAKKYDRTHHLTTRGQDRKWRQMAGWVIANFAVRRPKPKVLDLCTGTGLTIERALAVLHSLDNVADFVGLDFSVAMLDQAQERFGKGVSNVQLLHGDAMDLVGKSKNGLFRFNRGSFDVITQVFGIGGIENPLKVFDGVLALLRLGGQYFFVDMHRPIPSQPGEFPLFGWMQMPYFERFVYAKITIPLMLARLWGWRDTTLDFYLAPLSVERMGKKFYGFRILWRHVVSERWWFSLPFMPIGRLLLEKVEISEEEYHERQRILDSVE